MEQLQHSRKVVAEQEVVRERQTTMVKGGLHMSRRSMSSDLNLTESDVKVRTDNRNETPVTSIFDSHSVRTVAPDIGIMHRNDDLRTVS